MSGARPIVFYDIPADSIEGKAWSPNTWKTRFALNFKGVPYQTEWIEYPDIADKWKSLGIPHSSYKADGSPHYTCPAIVDPSTGAKVSNSIQIAVYLDQQYPNEAKLFPPGTHALQHAFFDTFEASLVPLFQFGLPATFKRLNVASQQYFRETREKRLGKKMEEATPVGEERAKEWAKVQAAFDAANKWYQKGEADGPYLLGKKPGFADFVVASWAFWLKKVCGEGSSEWKDICSWNGGRWASLIDSLEPYQTIV